MTINQKIERSVDFKVSEVLIKIERSEMTHKCRCTIFDRPQNPICGPHCDQHSRVFQFDYEEPNNGIEEMKQAFKILEAFRSDQEAEDAPKGAE